MKPLIKLSLIILIIVALIALVASVYFYGEVNKDYQTDAENFGQNPDYVFSLVMETGDIEYLNKIKAGAYAAALNLNVAVEFHETNELLNGLTNADYVEIARLAELDGIIISGSGNARFISAVETAVGEGLPVIVSGSSDIQCSRDIFVGTNQYEFGSKAAELAAEAVATDGYVYLAVILSSDNEDITDEDQIDRRIRGITAKIQTIGNMRLITTEKTSSNIIGAEDVTQKIMREYPEVNVIFCMNSKDTIAAAQAVVDRNRVGDVRIIGTDITPEILDFIDKSIIYGVIDRNADEIGKQSIEGLINLIDGKLQSSYINVDMQIITKENASYYAE